MYIIINTYLSSLYYQYIITISWIISLLSLVCIHYYGLVLFTIIYCIILYYLLYYSLYPIEHIWVQPMNQMNQWNFQWFIDLMHSLLNLILVDISSNQIVFIIWIVGQWKDHQQNPKPSGNKNVNKTVQPNELNALSSFV